jgi:hypothetical protein
VAEDIQQIKVNAKTINDLIYPDEYRTRFGAKITLQMDEID